MAEDEVGEDNKLKMKNEKLKSAKIFSEDVISYALWKFYIPKESTVFFKISHNIDVKTFRGWDYWCAPEVDVIEMTKGNVINAYEIKGIRRKKELLEWPAFYDGIGQTLAYLNLPYVGDSSTPKDSPECFDKFGGGAFDFIYLVYTRDKIENFSEYEKQIFDLLPIGVILATPEGKFGIVKEAPLNPLQSKEAKEHFLKNLNTLEAFSVNSKIFRKIRIKGENYFSNK